MSWRGPGCQSHRELLTLRLPKCCAYDCIYKQKRNTHFLLCEVCVLRQVLQRHTGAVEALDDV